MRAMTRARRRARQEPPARDPIIITISTIILAIMVLAAAAMLVPPLRTALVEGWQVQPKERDCSTLETSVREACAARHPAKGANAPLAHRPSGQSGE
jgi:hypothetical protein